MTDVAQLYIISEGPDGPIKIGRSVSARGRLPGLQTGNPRPLTILAAYTMATDQVIEAEICLHEELEFRALVGEWFNLSERFILAYMPDFFLSEGFEVDA